MDQLDFYFLSREGTDRDARMIHRFNTLMIPAQRVEWVSNDWLKQKGYDRYSCPWGHFKMLSQFVNNSTKEFGMFFEDDVYLSKDLPTDLSFLINNMKKYKLDVLLTGYLIDRHPCKIDNSSIMTVGFYKFDNELWGSQSYILTKNHAKYLLNKYNENYLDRCLAGEKLVPFSPDWTITKDGNRAIVYPMYAVEEGNINSDHQGQINFHRSCTQFNYKKDYYI